MSSAASKAWNWARTTGGRKILGTAMVIAGAGVTMVAPPVGVAMMVVGGATAWEAYRAGKKEKEQAANAYRSMPNGQAPYAGPTQNPAAERRSGQTDSRQMEQAATNDLRIVQAVVAALRIAQQTQAAPPQPQRSDPQLYNRAQEIRSSLPTAFDQAQGFRSPAPTDFDQAQGFRSPAPTGFDQASDYRSAAPGEPPSWPLPQQDPRNAWQPGLPPLAPTPARTPRFVGDASAFLADSSRPGSPAVSDAASDRSVSISPINTARFLPPGVPQPLPIVANADLYNPPTPVNNRPSSAETVRPAVQQSQSPTGQKRGRK